MADVPNLRFDEDALLDPPPAAAAVEPDVPHFQPYMELDWSKYPYIDPDDPVTDPTFCFWSEMSVSQRALRDNQAVQDLRKMHTENFGRMHPFAFCRMMQEYYNEHLRPYFADPRDPIYGDHIRGPHWPAENIYMYGVRRLDPYSVAVYQAGITSEIMLRLAHKSLFLSDGTVDRGGATDFAKVRCLHKKRGETLLICYFATCVCLGRYRYNSRVR